MSLFFSDIESVEKKLGYHFKNKDLLILALIHRSYWNEHRELVKEHNERLEFLGDSILGMIIADYLYNTQPLLDEGSLSRLRSVLVDTLACVGYVQKLDIEKYLMLGKGELLNQGKGRESILADLFEALIAAIYLDGGMSTVKQFFLNHFEAEVTQMLAKPSRNWKAELQDYAQKEHQQTPVYTVLEEKGPAHHKFFYVAVWIHDTKMGEGEGSSKKAAQAEAARDALMKMQTLKD